jgi:hypothetical protein
VGACQRIQLSKIIHKPTSAHANSSGYAVVRTRAVSNKRDYLALIGRIICACAVEVFTDIPSNKTVQAISDSEISFFIIFLVEVGPIIYRALIILLGGDA